MSGIKVLDKGFLRLIETMGGDSGIVQAARVSHAQAETQRCAEAISTHFVSSAPWTYEAFLANVWKGSNARLDAEKEKACAPLSS